MNASKFDQILAEHELWLAKAPGGAKADFSNQRLRHTDFRSDEFVSIDLRKANFAGADLRGADFSRAELEGANFNGACLRGADFSGADLSGCDLRGVDASDAIFRGCDLSNANLQNANFTDANLRDADLTGSDQDNTNFDGALFGPCMTLAQGTATIGVTVKQGMTDQALRDLVMSKAGTDVIGGSNTPELVTLQEVRTQFDVMTKELAGGQEYTEVLPWALKHIEQVGRYKGQSQPTTAVQEWQPIETAPRDGTWIIVGGMSQSGKVPWAETGCWSNSDPENSWFLLFHDNKSPTHWLPLPAFPTVSKA